MGMMTDEQWGHALREDRGIIIFNCPKDHKIINAMILFVVEVKKIEFWKRFHG